MKQIHCIKIIFMTIFTVMLFSATTHCPPNRRMISRDQRAKYQRAYEKAMAQAQKYLAEAARYKALADGSSTQPTRHAPHVPARQIQPSHITTPISTIQPTPPTSGQAPEFFNKLAQQLQEKADELDRVHPMSLGASSREQLQDLILIAAALRSHAQHMRIPGSPITEYHLQTTSPATLETLATKLEREKYILDQKSTDQVTLQDHERKKELAAEITALRAQAKLIRDIRK